MDEAAALSRFALAASRGGMSSAALGGPPFYRRGSSASRKRPMRFLVSGFRHARSPFAIASSAARTC